MNLKAIALKLATLGTLAAAFFVASPAKANAQVSFGVRVGGPVVYPYGHVRPYYAPPVYGGYGYYGHAYYGHPYYGRGFYGHPYYGHPYGYGYHRY